MFAPAGRITARASRLCRLAALVVRRQALAPWNPKVVGRGRAGLKNRQDTFFDAPPTRSRLTAPPKKCGSCGFTRLILSYGWSVGRGLDPSLPPCGYCNNQKSSPRRGGACPARGFAAISILRVFRRGGIYAARCSHPGNAIYRVNCHGTHICVPYKPSGKHRNIAEYGNDKNTAPNPTVRGGIFIGCWLYRAS